MHELKVKPVNRVGAPIGNANRRKIKQTLSNIERQTVLKQRAKATNFKGDLDKMNHPMLCHKIGLLLFRLNQSDKLHKDEVTEIWDACSHVMIVMHRWAASIGLNLYAGCNNLNYIPEYITQNAEDQQTRRSLTPEQKDAMEYQAAQAYMNMDTKATATMGRKDWNIFKDMCLERIEPVRIKELAYKFIHSMEI